MTNSDNENATTRDVNDDRNTTAPPVARRVTDTAALALVEDNTRITFSTSLMHNTPEGIAP